MDYNNTAVADNSSDPATMSDEAYLKQMVEQTCQETVNRLVAVWLVQLMSNLTVHNATTTNETIHNPDKITSTLDSVANIGPKLLQAAMLKLLAEDADIKAGVETVLTTSETFPAAVYDNMVSTIKGNANIFFLLTTGIFIYFMQTGFALMEVGMVRTKNTGNSIWKNVSYSFASALGYWLTGMAMSFGTTEGRFVGTTFWAFKDMAAASGGANDLMFFFFEFVFCTTAGAIMTGSIAERAQLGCYIIYTLVASAVTYPIIVHWTWTADGWLKYGRLYEINGEEVRIGYEDFAGSGIVHGSGGMAALIAIIFIGPRIGRFGPNGEVREINGHSAALVGAGAMTLFTGFLAFNAGSELAISNDYDAEPINRATVNTIICGTGGFITVGLLTRIMEKRWLYIPMLCGGLSGNVAACCNCHTVDAWAAFCIGIIAGLVFMLVSWGLKKLRIDDAADAVGVHWGGGFAGCLGLALFKLNVGILYNWDYKSGVVLGWQMLGFFSISAWSAANTWVIFYILKSFNMVRVDPESELVGLDYAHGHELPYPGDAYKAPCVSGGNGDSLTANMTREEIIERQYDQLYEEEMSKYTQEYIENPGWSHPVLFVIYDASWLCIVRSRRKEMQKRASFNSLANGHSDYSSRQPPLQLQRLGNGSAAPKTDSPPSFPPPPPPSLMVIDQGVNTVQFVEQKPVQVDASTNVSMKHRGDWRLIQQPVEPVDSGHVNPNFVN